MYDDLSGCSLADVLEKREKGRIGQGRHRSLLEIALADVLHFLANDMPLSERYRDHSLSGEAAGFRDCHLKRDAETLRLVRLGSHSALGW